MSATQPQAGETVEVTRRSKPEFMLPAAPRNQQELIVRLSEDETRLKIKAETARTAGNLKEGERLALEGDMQHRMFEHLSKIGQDCAKETFSVAFPNISLYEVGDHPTKELEEAENWTLDVASNMSLSVVQKRLEGYKLKIEAEFAEKNGSTGEKSLMVSQRRDLQAVDNLTALLKTYQPKSSKAV